MSPYFEPVLPGLLLIGLLGLIAAWRRTARRRGLAVAVAGLVGVGLYGSNWVAWAASWPLERAYERAPVPAGLADAIVVLSGAAERPTAAQPYSMVSIDTYRRLRHGIWLFRHWQPLPILVSGGSTVPGGPPLAQSMREVLTSEGIPPDRVWTEDRSRSTHENAVFSADILRTRGVSRVVLVVEALGMPRAAAAFEKAGVQVVPAPIRFAELDGTLEDVLPGWRPMVRNGEVVHEVLGLMWYRLRGWI